MALLPSSNRSIGEKSVTILPANRSNILADSRFRVDNIKDTPYDFTVNLGGTGIYAKEVYYQKLYWTQPIFCHNNLSNELRFSLNEDDSIIYIVYATPFLMFKEYDGNPPGTSLLAPQPYSYCDNMEQGLNGDLRTFPLNTTLVNGDGLARDSLGNIIQINFRYSPSRGFCIYPVQDLLNYPNGYSIKLLPCNYIENAHFVHGFGVFNPNVDLSNFTPYDFYSTVVWSDTTPNLLPMRYIVVQSAELNKDRRMVSFHNGNFAHFVNELTIFSINPARTGVYHEDATGEDATVVSLRDDYTPQRFRIQILDEYGDLIIAGDPLRTALGSSIIPVSQRLSFMNTGTNPNRGDPGFMNALMFGTQIVYAGNSGPPTLTGIYDTSQYDPLSYLSPIVETGIPPPVWNPSGSNRGYLPLILTTAPLTPVDAPSSVGFSSVTQQYINSGLLNEGRATAFTWYPAINPNPAVTWDLVFQNFYEFPNPQVVIYTCYMVMFSAVNVTVMIGYAPLGQIVFTDNTGVGNVQMPLTQTVSWTWTTPSYFENVETVSVSFAYYVTTNIDYSGLTVQSLNVPYGMLAIPVQDFTLANNSILIYDQTEYNEPPISEYAWGNPLSIALPEELIHEIAAINEYN